MKTHESAQRIPFSPSRSGLKAKAKGLGQVLHRLGGPWLCQPAKEQELGCLGLLIEVSSCTKLSRLLTGPDLAKIVGFHNMLSSDSTQVRSVAPIDLQVRSICRSSNYPPTFAKQNKILWPQGLGPHIKRANKHVQWRKNNLLPRLTLVGS